MYNNLATTTNHHEPFSTTAAPTSPHPNLSINSQLNNVCPISPTAAMTAITMILLCACKNICIGKFSAYANNCGIIHTANKDVINKTYHNAKSKASDNRVFNGDSSKLNGTNMTSKYLSYGTNGVLANGSENGWSSKVLEFRNGNCCHILINEKVGVTQEKIRGKENYPRITFVQPRQRRFDRKVSKSFQFVPALSYYQIRGKENYPRITFVQPRQRRFDRKGSTGQGVNGAESLEDEVGRGKI
uniref:Uncharacterized protein n=1 Tax=Solanum lycopersicum TaxID=4081 RepID=A0A3Q7H8X3_SOLLC